MLLNLFTKYLLELQVGVTTFFTFQYATEADLLQRVRARSLPILSISIVLNCPRQGLEHITDHRIIIEHQDTQQTQDQSPDDASPIQSRTSSS